MKAIVVGMGVQGEKRKKILGDNFVYSVDKFKKADFKEINQIPLKNLILYFCVSQTIKK